MARIGLPQIASGPASHRLPWQTSGGESQSITRSYFAADNKLRFQQVYLVPTNSAGFFDPPPPQMGSWEEHWYDALGRKVLTRARRDSLCSTTATEPCTSYIERTVWDGDQILYELRTKGGDTVATATLNADVSSASVQLGKVGYVHAGGIDAPLVLMNGRVPNYNWRGLAESSVWLDGSAADCTVSVGSPCTQIYWPGNQGVYMKPPLGQTSLTDVGTWVGSLLANGVGSTGIAYRRNRFYDGATGQFNQQDPIGLAGGANSYGFAGGDPVTYSDPYGLMAGCQDANGNAIPCPEPPGGPPIILGDGKNGKPNYWVPVPGSEGGTRGTKYKPRWPLPSETGLQPGASWDDKQGHWDVKGFGGKKGTRRYLPDGTEVDHDNKPVKPSSIDRFIDFLNQPVPEWFPTPPPLLGPMPVPFPLPVPVP